jgi:hypothetical protein
VRDFNTSLSSINRSGRQKINEEILDLNDTIDQMELTDLYRVFHLATAQYMFSSAAHGTFSKTETLGHKDSLKKYKKIEIIPCILSGHKAIKLELNKKAAAE